MEVRWHPHTLVVADANLVHADAGGLWVCDSCREPRQTRYIVLLPAVDLKVPAALQRVRV